MELYSTLLWIRNYFFSDPDSIFRRVLDPDPTWLVESFGSDLKHSLFHNANDSKWLFLDFEANFSKKMLY
jgi:hypothetical protein